MRPQVSALIKLGACSDAVVYAKKHKTWQSFWDTCPRGDWLLWLLGNLAGPVDSKSRKKLVRVCAEIAELVLPISDSFRPDDKFVRNCIEMCKRYAHGQATIKEVRAARVIVADAYAHADYAYAAAAYAVYTAAYAAESDSEYTADAAYAADDAAAAYVGAYADSIATRVKMQRKCADIVRKYYPTAPVLP